MPDKIVLTVDDGLTEQERTDLRYLLSDALGEFAGHRTPADDYVARRYPGPDYFPDREEKVAQVRRRNALARKLHGAALSFEVERQPLHTETLLAAAAKEGAGRAKQAVEALCELFDLSVEEGRATYNQLEDKRVSRLMARPGLVKP